MTTLFAYGTLMAPALFELIAGTAMDSRPAVLQGYRRFAFANERYPGLIPGTVADRTKGLAIANISTSIWQRLDAYESDMYSRQQVMLEGPSGERLAAQTYLVKPQFRYLLADYDWDFENFLNLHLNAYLDRMRG